MLMLGSAAVLQDRELLSWDRKVVLEGASLPGSQTMTPYLLGTVTDPHILCARHGFCIYFIFSPPFILFLSFFSFFSPPLPFPETGSHAIAEADLDLAM